MNHRFANRVSRLGLILFAAGGLTALGCSLIVEFDESKIPGEDVGVSETSTDTQMPDTQMPDTQMPDTAMPTDSGTDTGTTDTGTPTDTGTDTGTPTDTGTDTGTPTDTGTDTGTTTDTGSDTGTATDTATDDTATDDTGPADTGPADTGPADTGPTDTGVEDVADTAAVTLLFSTVMTGSQENPPVTTSATGTAQCTLTMTTTNSLSCTITHTVADTTAAHIHGRAPFGKNAGVLWPFSSGATGATLTQTLTTTEVDDLMAGRFYINVHSGGDAGFPGGEIRGQLIPKGATFYAGRFTNAAGTDAGTATSSGGFGVFVTAAPASVHYFGTVEGLSGAPTDAHVHDPAAVLFGLTVLGTADMATTTYLGTPTLTTTQLTEFVTKAEANTTYANVHTALVPGGEARADLTRIFIAP